MDFTVNDTPGLATLFAYGLLILLYLVILRLLLNLLQQLGDKHRTQRSVIDSDIHRTMSRDLDVSMQAFNPYAVAIVITKFGIAAIAMAAMIVLMVFKVGLVATILLITIVIFIAWGMNRWLRTREHVGTIGQINKVIKRSGSFGTVVVLSIVLVAVLFLMIVLH